MTERPFPELTKDELFQAFKGIVIACAARLKERGEPPDMFGHCKKAHPTVVVRSLERVEELKAAEKLMNQFTMLRTPIHGVVLGFSSVGSVADRGEILR